MRLLSTFNLKLGQRLLENRWLFIVLLSGFAFIFESTELILGLEPVDAQYYREVVFFVVIYPIFVGWILSVLLKVQTERNEALQQQKFIEDMLAVPSWNALLETITTIPRRIAPVVAVGLYLQSLENEGYSLAAEWSLLHPDVRFSLQGIDPISTCGGGEHHSDTELHPFKNNGHQPEDAQTRTKVDPAPGAAHHRLGGCRRAEQLRNFKHTKTGETKNSSHLFLYPSFH